MNYGNELNNLNGTPKKNPLAKNRNEGNEGNEDNTWVTENVEEQVGGRRRHRSRRHRSRRHHHRRHRTRRHR